MHHSVFTFPFNQHLINRTISLLCLGLMFVLCRVGGGQHVDLSIGSDQYPEDDAVILRWEQHWEMSPSGQITRIDHKWIKLLNRRAIRRYADPRIDYSTATDEMKILVARTHLPDGTILPVPDYSFNIASPSDLSGWPEYVDWQQTIVSFSGIVNDCILELAYQVTTEAGVLPWLDADLRLDSDDPVHTRIVSVTIPDEYDLHFQVSNCADNGGPSNHRIDGKTQFTWRWDRLAGTPGEPQSYPWYQRCPRLQFTSCDSAGVWIVKIQQSVDQAAVSNDDLTQWIQEITEDELDAAAKVEKVTDSLKSTFNFIHALRSYRSWNCRNVGEVFQTNYGNPMEAAALLMSAYQSLGLTCRSYVAVDSMRWDDRVPTGSAFSAVVIEVDTGEGTQLVHPERGILHNPGSWGQHTLLHLDSQGTTQSIVLADRSDSASNIKITGKVTLAEDGTAAGTIQLHCTGGFYDPARLDSADAQESFTKRLVRNLLTGFDLDQYSVVTLSDQALQIEAQVKTSEPLDQLGDHYVLTFGNGPVSLSTYPLPLERSYRRTDVHLKGAFSESVDLYIEWPETCTIGIVPAELSNVTGSWGSVGQEIHQEPTLLRLKRHLEVNTDLLNPIEFDQLRSAVNALRSTGALKMMYGKDS